MICARIDDELAGRRDEGGSHCLDIDDAAAECCGDVLRRPGGIAGEQRLGLDQRADQGLDRTGMALEERARHRRPPCPAGRGTARRRPAMRRTAGLGLLDDGERRLAHGGAFHRVGQHGLLGGVDAHRHDLDIGGIGLDALPQPVLQRGVGDRAGRLRGEARRLAGGGAKTREGLRRRHALREMGREPRRARRTRSRPWRWRPPP